MEVVMKKFLLILICTSLTACSSLQTVDFSPENHSQEILANILPGDNIYIETQDGQEYEFEVESINTDSVKGEGNEVSLSDIKILEREEFSLLKTITYPYLGLVILVLLAGGVGPIG